MVRLDDRVVRRDLVVNPLAPFEHLLGRFAIAQEFASEESSETYNGAERFSLDKKAKKLYVDSKPSFKSFGHIFLQNSPIALKYALPQIIASGAIEKKVSTTCVDGRDIYMIEFALPKGTINSAGEIVEIRPDQTNKYQLIVDKGTLLPVQVVQSNDKNDEVLKTTYAELTERPAPPSAQSWFFSTFQNEYAIQKKTRLTLLEAGKTAPVFSLARFGEGFTASLDNHKGKLVLLEFWIAHCGFCIAAVPKLNDLSSRFRQKGLEIVSVNMYDPAATIKSFVEKHKPAYPVLTGGEAIAEAYGVDAYPALVLIDGSGKVVYSASGLDEKELEREIVANLNRAAAVR